MKRSYGVILFFAVLIFGTWFIQKKFSFTSYLSTGINVKQYGEECEYAGKCGNIIAVNCRAEVDGPLYYVDRPTGKIIEYCGGHCMRGPSEQYCRNCPPKAWKCNIGEL